VETCVSWSRPTQHALRRLRDVPPTRLRDVPPTRLRDVPPTRRSVRKKTVATAAKRWMKRRKRSHRLAKVATHGWHAQRLCDGRGDAAMCPRCFYCSLAIAPRGLGQKRRAKDGGQKTEYKPMKREAKRVIELGNRQIGTTDFRIRCGGCRRTEKSLVQVRIPHTGKLPDCEFLTRAISLPILLRRRENRR